MKGLVFITASALLALALVGGCEGGGYGSYGRAYRYDPGLYMYRGDSWTSFYGSDYRFGPSYYWDFPVRTRHPRVVCERPRIDGRRFGRPGDGRHAGPRGGRRR